MTLFHVNVLLKYGNLHPRFHVLCHATHYTMWKLWLSGFCILVVVLHVAQNIMQFGSLWRSDN